jgi:hypothetical protein
MIQINRIDPSYKEVRYQAFILNNSGLLKKAINIHTEGIQPLNIEQINKWERKETLFSYSNSGHLEKKVSIQIHPNKKSKRYDTTVLESRTYNPSGNITSYVKSLKNQRMRYHDGTKHAIFDYDSSDQLISYHERDSLYYKLQYYTRGLRRLKSKLKDSDSLFVSTHSHFYKRKNGELSEEICIIENDTLATKNYIYFPKEKLLESYTIIKITNDSQVNKRIYYDSLDRILEVQRHYSNKLCINPVHIPVCSGSPSLQRGSSPYEKYVYTDTSFIVQGSLGDTNEYYSNKKLLNSKYTKYYYTSKENLIRQEPANESFYGSVYKYDSRGQVTERVDVYDGNKLLEKCKYFYIYKD